MSTDTMSTDTTKTKCKYWDRCFRNNPAHRKQYLHPSNVKVKDDSDEEDDKPSVKMGQVNIQHNICGI